MAEHKDTCDYPKVTPQQVADYISRDGCGCPRCDSYNVDVGQIHQSNVASVIARRVVCCACGLAWEDTYELVGVCPLAGPDDTTPDPELISPP